MKLFTFIQSQNKTATLICPKPLLPEYLPKITELLPSQIKKSPDEIPVNPVQVYEAESITEAVDSSIKVILNSNFTLIHSRMEAVNESRKDQLKKLDSQILELFNNISLNGMFIVIFGGTKDALQSGACFVRINKPKIH